MKVHPVTILTARRLRGPALLVELPQPLPQRLAVAALQAEVDRQDHLVLNGAAGKRALAVIKLKVFRREGNDVAVFVT